MVISLFEHFILWHRPATAQVSRQDACSNYRSTKTSIRKSNTQVPLSAQETHLRWNEKHPDRQTLAAKKSFRRVTHNNHAGIAVMVCDH
jgi:hypothetical protein